MTVLNYSISVRETNQGPVKITSISNGPQCTTCLTLENGEKITISDRDIDRDIVPVNTANHDYMVWITKEAA